MKYSFVLHSEEQLEWLRAFPKSEVVLYHTTWSREGGLAEVELRKVAAKAEELGHTVCLQFDRLIEEQHFPSYLESCLSYPTSWMLRVQDLGLAHSLSEKGREFQLVLEAGHANQQAISIWRELMGSCLKKIVLNNEIPKRNLHPLLSNLNGIDTETLGFGSLVMYYTPRSLLSWTPESAKESLIKSNEMGPGSYRLNENEAGTVMYFNKDLCLIRYIEELDEAGLTHLRIDLREVDSNSWEALFESIQKKLDVDIKETWPRPLLHGFYGENKSDSVFDRLSTKKVEWEQQPFGEVLDQTKSRLLIKLWEEDLKFPLQLNAKDGKARWHSWEVNQVESLSGQVMRQTINEEVFFIERPRRFPSGTLLYRGEKGPI